MAIIKISDLAALTTPDNADELVIVDTSTTTTKKISFTNLLTHLQSIFYYINGSDVAVADGGTGASDASGARTNLGLVIGTNVQAYDANLTTWAGKTAPSGTVVGTTDTQTLEEKRITKRAGTTTSTSSLTITSDSIDIYTVTALAEAMTINAPSGTPTQGQPLLIRIKDNGTARALTWNSAFRVIGTTLPTTTVINKTTYVGAVYNTADSKWDVIASLQEV